MIARSCIFVVFLFFSCNSSKEEKAKTPGKKVYDMYEHSEMALYMHAIYEINEQIKLDIEAGRALEKFPAEFLKIHSAEFSDGFGRDENFDAFSKLFLQQVELVFDSTSSIPVKQRYNDAINLCVSCHQTSCTGPIPRIKKLLIK